VCQTLHASLLSSTLCAPARKKGQAAVAPPAVPPQALDEAALISLLSALSSATEAAAAVTLPARVAATTPSPAPSTPPTTTHPAAVGLCERLIWLYGTALYTLRTQRASLSQITALHRQGVATLSALAPRVGFQRGAAAAALSASAPAADIGGRLRWVAAHADLLLPLEYRLSSSGQGDASPPPPSPPPPSDPSLPLLATSLPFLAIRPHPHSPAGRAASLAPTPSAHAWRDYVSYVEKCVVERLDARGKGEAAASAAAAVVSASSSSSASAAAPAASTGVSPTPSSPSSTVSSPARALPSPLRRRRAVALLRLYREADTGVLRAHAESASSSLGPNPASSARGTWDVPEPLVGLLRGPGPDAAPDSLPFLRDRCRLLLRMAAAADSPLAAQTWGALEDCRPDVPLVVSVLRECAAMVTAPPAAVVAGGADEDDASSVPWPSDLLARRLDRSGSRRAASRCAQAVQAALVHRSPADALATRLSAGLLLHMRTPGDDATKPAERRALSREYALAGRAAKPARATGAAGGSGGAWTAEGAAAVLSRGDARVAAGLLRGTLRAGVAASASVSASAPASASDPTLSVPQAALLHYLLLRAADTVCALSLLSVARTARWANRAEGPPAPSSPLLAGLGRGVFGVETGSAGGMQGGTAGGNEMMADEDGGPLVAPRALSSAGATPGDVAASRAVSLFRLLDDVRDSHLLPPDVIDRVDEAARDGVRGAAGDVLGV
jgi:hypothetical protein